ncbi:MAG TPA: hypothetical protein VI603_09310 [Saprospiraceae bacterium]|nr:hypothetical protein [Saprospiraceae bacterium]
MANVTYLLGAGASANALPVVTTMERRMVIFLEWLVRNGIIPDARISALEKLLKSIAGHLSIDTYAKKLFLTENHQQLNRLRRFLSAYLILEQSDEILQYSTWYLGGKPPGNKDSFSEMGVQLDLRYDAFMAALLEKSKNELILPKNVRIISWNYDHQIENAYLGFCESYDISNAQRCLNMFPNPGELDALPSEQYGIVRLNGCGVLEMTQHEKMYQIRAINEFNGLTKEKIKYILEGDHEAAWTPMISFAWEKNRYIFHKAAEIARTAATEIIRQTDILVIIGYSFPLFNREIDCEILKPLDLAKEGKVFIQVLEKDYLSCRSRLISIYPNLNDDDVAHVQSVDQFFVPFELNRVVNKRGTARSL